MDLIEKETDTSRRFELAIKDKLGRTNYTPVIFISALTKQRIFKLVELAKDISAERKKKISTAELNNILLEDIKKNPPPSTHTGREVKIKYITQVGDNYPVFLFFSNYPKDIPDHYKKFLENKIREHFGFNGVPFTLSFKNK